MAGRVLPRPAHALMSAATCSRWHRSYPGFCGNMSFVGKNRVTQCRYVNGSEIAGNISPARNFHSRCVIETERRLDRVGAHSIHHVLDLIWHVPQVHRKTLPLLGYIIHRFGSVMLAVSAISIRSTVLDRRSCITTDDFSIRASLIFPIPLLFDARSSPTARETVVSPSHLLNASEKPTIKICLKASRRIPLFRSSLRNAWVRAHRKVPTGAPGARLTLGGNPGRSLVAPDCSRHDVARISQLQGISRFLRRHCHQYSRRSSAQTRNPRHYRT